MNFASVFGLKALSESSALAFLRQAPQKLLTGKAIY